MTACTRAAALAAFTSLVALSDSASAVVIPTVPIGHAGNAADPATGGLYGSVAYSYNIGTTEVTNAQYGGWHHLRTVLSGLARRA